MSNESDSIPKMMDFFADISRRTFSTSIIKKLSTYAFMILGLADSVFSADALRKGLQNHFHPQGTALFAPAMHTGIMSSGTRVAVTSAKDMGQTACLITSYNHPSSTYTAASSALATAASSIRSGKSSSSSSGVSVGSGHSIPLEREESADKDLKIWEAALATSAAPFYLPAFEKRETGTSYVDGAVYANCPAQVAFSEVERIWPDAGAPLDALVSVGTGVQQRTRRAAAAGDDHPGPGLVNAGFFVSLRAMFRRQLDSKGSWRAFRDVGCPAAARCRLRRLDPPLGIMEDYVEMYDHGKIEELKDAVGRWAEEERAAAEVREIADLLLAGLFFFEPDGRGGTSERQKAPRLLADPSLETLAGSIRCRLGHGTPELKRLLGEIVQGFYYVQLPPGSGRATGNVLEEVARMPASTWERVTVSIRGRDARPGEMLVSEGGVQKFRLPYVFGVKKGSAAVQVLGVKLARCEHLVPISGFPTTMAELRRRAKMVWLQ
jgi:hypothetical protein